MSKDNAFEVLNRAICNKQRVYDHLAMPKEVNAWELTQNPSKLFGTNQETGKLDIPTNFRKMLETVQEKKLNVTLGLEPLPEVVQKSLEKTTSTSSPLRMSKNVESIKTQFTNEVKAGQEQNPTSSRPRNG